MQTLTNRCKLAPAAALAAGAAGLKHKAYASFSEPDLGSLAQAGAVSVGRLSTKWPRQVCWWPPALALVLAITCAARAPAAEWNPFADLELYMASSDELGMLSDCLTEQFDDGGATVELRMPSPEFVMRARALLAAAGIDPYAGSSGQANVPAYRVLRDLRSLAREKREEEEDGLGRELLRVQAAALYLVELAGTAGGHCQPSPILLNAMAEIEKKY